MKDGGMPGWLRTCSEPIMHSGVMRVVVFDQDVSALLLALRVCALVFFLDDKGTFAALRRCFWWRNGGVMIRD